LVAELHDGERGSRKTTASTQNAEHEIDEELVIVGERERPGEPPAGCPVCHLSVGVEPARVPVTFQTLPKSSLRVLGVAERVAFVSTPPE
jgi:hypothetical protein